MADKNKRLDQIYFPKIHPEKLVREYLQSKAETKLFKKHPEWDVARVGPEAQLIVARRNLERAQVLLDRKKDEAKKVRAYLGAQWSDLEKREEALKGNFIKFNKFVRENQEKRKRVERKIEEEIETQNKKQELLDDLCDKYEFMVDVRKRMEEGIVNHRIYEDYLLFVLKSTSEFKNMSDILNHYEALQEVKDELAQRQEMELTALEEARNDLLKLTEDKALEIMGFNNKVIELQSRYEVAKSKAMQWEAIVGKIKDISSDKMLELHVVKDCTWSIYKEMCERKEIAPEFHKSDFENQLVFIRSTLLELKQIIANSKRRIRQHVT